MATTTRNDYFYLRKNGSATVVRSLLSDSSTTGKRMKQLLAVTTQITRFFSFRNGGVCSKNPFLFLAKRQRHSGEELT